MRKDAREFLIRLLNEPAPSNFETPAQKIWRERVESTVDRVEADVYGNHVAIREGSENVSVAIVGHSDEVGLIVRRIEDSGMLRFGKIGGIDPAVLPGTRVRVLTKRGVVPGVIGAPAVHLIPPSESKKPKLSDLCIDIGAKDGATARKIVEIGDPAVFGEDFADLADDFACHRAFDNRMGCWVVAEMLRLLPRKKLRATVYGVSSVQEETGVWGAGLFADRYQPTLAIAVDVTHDTNTPGVPSDAHPDITCGKGPVIGRGVRVNRKISDLLAAAAKTAKIPVQFEIDEGATGTDADPISARRTGIPVGTVSVACRYMHTPCEVIHLGDLEQAAKLIAQFVEGISAKTKLAAG
ncbi:MAG: M20/M25/M40 family metallo-hydrolase [bacterium]